MYYIIVWAIDRWGNAKWICLHVGNNPYYYEKPSGRVFSNNMKGVFDHDLDLWNHYYTLDGVAYIPNIKIVSEVSKGFSITLPPNTSLSMSNVVISSRAPWGIYIYRYWALFARYSRIHAGSSTIMLIREPLIPSVLLDPLLIIIVVLCSISILRGVSGEDKN